MQTTDFSFLYPNKTLGVPEGSLHLCGRVRNASLPSEFTYRSIMPLCVTPNNTSGPLLSHLVEMSDCITRRLCIAAEVPQDDVFRAQFCLPFVNYGVMESVTFEGGTNYSNSTVHLQFQRLSAAEKFQADAVYKGQSWRVHFSPAIPTVGHRLLVTSCTELLGDSTICKLLKDGVTLECKAVRVPGEGQATHTTTSRTTENCWTEHAKAVALIRTHRVGQHVGLLAFASAHHATAFLQEHQRLLATANIIAQYVGPPGSPLSEAVDKMLTRHPLADLSESAVFRGYIVDIPSNTVCSVDIGVERDGHTVLVETCSNFLKVSVGDEVSIQVQQVDGAAGRVSASLQRVTTASASLVSAPSGKSAVNDSLGGVLARLKPSAVTGAAGGTHGIASKLFRAIQEKKAAGTLETAATPADAVLRERLCSTPKGLRLFTRLLVQVAQVTPEGLAATALREDGGPPCNYPVFIPAHLVPSDHGQSWDRYAVPGERMTVVLLYAVAVGGSQATRRCVASKLEADMRRSTAFVEGDDGGMETADDPEVLSVGQALSVTRMHVLQSDDIGCDGSDNFPAFLVRPAAGSPPAAVGLPLLLPSESAAVAAAMSPQTESVVVFKVVHDANRGYYAVLIDAAAYQRHVEVQKQADRQRRQVDRLLVKQRLAAVLGEDAVKDINDSSDTDEPSAMKRRAE